MFYASPSRAIVGVVIAQTLFPTTGAQDVDTAPVVDLSALAPAAATVDGAQLFPSERLQLTDAVLANLTSHGIDASLFSFGTPDDAAALDKRSGACKVFPGDKAWPSAPVWRVLDLLSGGRLIATFMPMPMLYDFDPELTANQHGRSNLRNVAPLARPHPSPTTPCTLGGYPSYALNISSVAQIQLAVNFARHSRIRLVIKNTGHDFNGRSAGAGALAVWTHHLKDIKVIEKYTSPSSSYSGRAVKIGAGVQAFELYEAGKKYGFTAVGGEGKTVGIAGGYVAGGGHSPLSSIYGLAADQVLAFEIVLADGRFVTAREGENEELFWALRGGGGATYGVVTSVTFKVYPVMVATAVQFSFASNSSGGGVSVEAFWGGVRAYFDYFIPNTEAGTYSYFTIAGTQPGEFVFNMLPFFAPNMTEVQTAELLRPWLDDLEGLGIGVDPVYFPADNFHDAWDAGFPLEAVGGSAAKTGARLFPRKNWEDERTLNATFNAIKYPIEEGGMFLGFNIAAPGRGGFPDNAVNPAWRDTVLHAIAVIILPDPSPEAIAAQSEKLTMDWLQRWRDVSHGSGAYMSEADVTEPDVQQSFYGDSKYPRLYALKNKLDPYGLFYAPTAVGSEDWYVTDQIEWLPTQNGRLCRV